MRVGFGYDVHGFDESRPLVLGGVTIDGAPGLAGWSDADVLCHAVMDALLGAAGLGDLGTHFSEETVTEGASSLELLSRTSLLVAEAGFEIMNVDCLIVIQDLSVAPFRSVIEAKMEETLRLGDGAVNVKGTTTDRLGFVGRKEGAVAMAVVLLTEKSGASGRPL